MVIADGLSETRQRNRERLERAEELFHSFNLLDAAEAFGEVVQECAHDMTLAPLAARAQVFLGWIDESRGSWASAGERFAIAVNAGEQLQDSKLLARGALGRGVIFMHQRIISQAIDCLQLAVKEAVKAGETELVWRARIQLGTAFSLDGQLDEARNSWKAVIEKVQLQIDQGNDTAELRELMCLACNKFGIDLFRQRKTDQAFLSFKKGLTFVNTVQYSIARAEGLRYLGVIHSARKEYVEAMECFTQSLAILKYCYHTPSLARLYSSIGRTYLETGELQLASSNFQKAKALCVSLDLQSNVAEINSMLGHIAMRREEYSEALALYEEDMGITKQLDDKLPLGYAYKNLGTACKYLGRRQEAVDYFTKARECFHTAGNRYNEAHTLIPLGELAVEDDNLTRATELAFEAEGIFGGLDKLDDLGFVHQLLGQIHSAEGGAEKAEEHFAKAINIFRGNRWFVPLIEATFSLGELYTRRDRKDLALKMMTDAFRLAEKQKLSRTLARISQRIEDLDESEGLDLTVQSLVTNEIAVLKAEKEDIIRRRGRKVECAHLLVGFAGLEDLLTRTGRDKAQEMLSQAVTAVTAKLLDAGARLNFNAGFTMSFLAVSDENESLSTLLHRMATVLAGAWEDSDRLFKTVYAGEAGALKPIGLLDCGEFEFLAIAYGGARESFPLSPAIQNGMALMVDLHQRDAATFSVTPAAFDHLKSTGFATGFRRLDLRCGTLCQIDL